MKDSITPRRIIAGIALALCVGLASGATPPIWLPVGLLAIAVLL